MPVVPKIDGEALVNAESEMNAVRDLARKARDVHLEL